MGDIIEKAEGLFLKMIENNGCDPYSLRIPINEMNRWAEMMLKRYPEADRKIVFISIWLHDIGHYPINEEENHAVTGEKIARNFLEKENYPKDKLMKVLHCIRSHRCNTRDI